MTRSIPGTSVFVAWRIPSRTASPSSVAAFSGNDGMDVWFERWNSDQADGERRSLVKIL